MAEVKIPIGISAGAAKCLEKKSAAINNSGPRMNDESSKLRWSAPKSIREMWETMRPIKPMRPVNATATPTAKATNSRDAFFNFSTSNPTCLARSSPALSALRAL